MRRSHFITSIAAAALLLCSAASISAQVGQLRGSVKLIGADGQPAPVAGAAIDVFRTDLPGEYHTKTDKKGDWVFAGLPYVGTYIVAISAPGAQPNAKSNVKAGREAPVDVVLSPGDGRRLTLEEAKAVSTGGSSSSGGGGESAADKAGREEMLKKNKEMEESNKKNTNINQVVGEAFKTGNAALSAAGEAVSANKRDEAIRLFSDAVKQFDTGLAADPEQSALLTNKAAALKGLAVEKYNAAIQTKDDAARTAGIEAAKIDFKDAAETADKASEFIKKEPSATDPNDSKRHDANKYAALSVRAEAYRLYVSKGDPSKIDGGIAAFQDYMAVETDVAKKSKAQFDLAQMLLDAGAGDKAFAEYQKILAAKPDDPDANLGAGLALYSTGDKARYQEAANYFQHFVDKAPDTHKFKNDAKDILANLKNTDNVVPEKTNAPPRRKRP